LNISARLDASATSNDRDRLADELLNELTAWNPREWISALKKWHRGPLSALSLIHLNVVAELEANGPMSMGHLADALDVSVASATGIVSRMESRGIVKRRHGGDDRRVVMVHPTAKGAKIFREMDARRRGRLAELLKALSDEEMAGFLVGLRALRKARAATADEAATEATAERPAGHS